MLHAEEITMHLETSRLRLREFTLEDWPDVQAYCADPLVVQFMYFGPSSVEETKVHLHWCLEKAKEEPRCLYELGIVLKAEQRLIGSCTLALNPAERREAAFSYLLNRHEWGQGYATEAMHALFDFGFNVLGLHRVADAVDPANVASLRVLEKLGLRREGHLRAAVWHKERWWDEYIYAILDHEWQAQQSSNDH
jgi:[ribosomal protein S5]-alanine N-acetyltransferase